MNDIEVYFRERTIKCHKIGRFLVLVCCHEDLGQDAPHAVVHQPSMQVVRCGLRHEEAVYFADMLSLYSEVDPNTSSFSTARHMIGKALMNWVYAFADEPNFVTYYEAHYGKRPTPTQLTETDQSQTLCTSAN
jgi:hypothetical protein